jgi:phage FluMu protein Com
VPQQPQRSRLAGGSGGQTLVESKAVRAWLASDGGVGRLTVGQEGTVMSKSEKKLRCHHCNELMEDGYTTWTHTRFVGTPPVGSRHLNLLVFVVPGEPTSINPVKAFKQGLQENAASKAYELRGYRCPKCGTVELKALDSVECAP